MKKEKLLKIVALLLAVLVMAAAVSACTKPAESEDSAQASTEQSTLESEENTDEETGDAGDAGDESDPVVESDEAAEPHFVTDHAGNEVEIPATVERIVVCDIYPLPSILTVFFDSAEKIVGMAPPSMSAAKNSLLGKLYPEILNASTSFINGTTVNIEELAALKPDIVFYNAGNKSLGEEITYAGLTGFAMSAGKWGYDALETLNQWIKTFDEIFPGNDKYEVVEKYGKEVQKLVEERTASIEEKKKILFLFQYNENQVVVNGNPSFGFWWTGAIGGVNTVEEKTEANSLPVSMEQIYAMDPDVLFVTNFTTASADDIYENKIGTYDWSVVKAVKDKNVFKMPLGMYRSYTSGVDSPVALLWLAKAAYPEAFEDVDITEYTKDYYKAVFNVELTDEEADSIFAPNAGAGVMN